MDDKTLVSATKIRSGEKYVTTYQGIAALERIAQHSGFGIDEVCVENVIVRNEGVVHHFNETRFKHCLFDNAHFKYCTFNSVIFDNCEFAGDVDWTTKPGIKLINPKFTGVKFVTNEEIAKKVGGKVFSLPNKNFVKVCCTCDFCHNEFFEIMHRNKARKILKDVPNCDKQVCDTCFKNYKIQEKFPGHRTYGYHGSLSYYRTPMDKENTVILGLEMEFEGDFYGWKELQDAHKGMLHYGYDTSVVGQNELSWDCGSYSWWKYLSPLQDVCDVLGKYGGKAGDSAGIHIHVSRPDVNILDITSKINTICKEGVFKTMMEAVSLRNNRERFETYANLSIDCGAHHAAISYNSHNTCEFRVFNSCLDSKIIMHHLKFCKEFFNLVAEKTPKDVIIHSFSKETKKHILKCAERQLEKAFISTRAFNQLKKALN